MKYKTIAAAVLLSMLGGSMLYGRGTWTDRQARDWEKRTGILKGINGTHQAWKGQDFEEQLELLHGLGFNCVRVWAKGKDADSQISFLKSYAETAARHGMMVSPVLRWDYLGDDFDAASQEVKKVVAALRKDKRIALWDVWNEPANRFSKKENECIAELDRVARLVRRCQEANPVQPVTASVFWGLGASPDFDSPVFMKMREVEALMDVHNFHDYVTSVRGGDATRRMLDLLTSVSDKPLVCTECMQRTNGSGVGRSLAVFSEKHAHFFVWGSYLSDANWGVRWKKSELDPWDIPFHDMLWNDGEPIDWREIEMVRGFRWTDPGETAPGIEITERWSRARAWQRLSQGPVKGCCSQPVPEGFNSLRLSLSIADWKSDPKAFFESLDGIMKNAKASGTSVLPVLLDDSCMDEDKATVKDYLADVLERYYRHPSVLAWDLWWHPGEKCPEAERVAGMVALVFRTARDLYTNQPLTMTPAVGVNPFPEGFNPKAALVHGKRNGWNRLAFTKGCTQELLYTIWSLSDVIAFSTDADPDRTAWMTAMARRFGRPMLCTCTGPLPKKTLQGFARSHVFFWTDAGIPASDLAAFRFIPIETSRAEVIPMP